MLGPGEVQPRDRARHPHREMGVVVQHPVVLAVHQEHGGRRARRGGLAEVVCGRLARGGAVDEEAAPADVAGGGVGHREREGGGDGGVDGVPALAHHLRPDRRGEGVLRDDHRPPGAYRLGAAGKGGGQPQPSGEDEPRRGDPALQRVPHPSMIAGDAGRGQVLRLAEPALAFGRFRRARDLPRGFRSRWESRGRGHYAAKTRPRSRCGPTPALGSFAGAGPRAASVRAKVPFAGDRTGYILVSARPRESDGKEVPR